MCTRYKDGPYEKALLSLFLDEKVTEAVPFTYTGKDYCGPLVIKSKAEARMNVFL